MKINSGDLKEITSDETPKEKNTANLEENKNEELQEKSFEDLEENESRELKEKTVQEPKEMKILELNENNIVYLEEDRREDMEPKKKSEDMEETHIEKSKHIEMQEELIEENTLTIKDQPAAGNIKAAIYYTDYNMSSYTFCD